MTEMWYSLPENVELHKRSNYCLITDKYLNKAQILHPAEALVMSLLDGRTTRDELAYLVTQTYGMDEEKGLSLVEKVLRVFKIYLKSTSEPQPRPGRYDPLEFVFPGFRKRPDGTGLLDAPVEIDLMLTRRCNFACRYCVHGTGHQPDEYLNTDAALRVIEEAADLGVVTVTLSGGEPTLHPALPEIISAVIRHKMECFVSTNGSLLDERMSEALAATGMHTIQVSLDSPSPDTHHFLTQTQNTFDRVLAGIDRLKAQGLRVRSRSVLTPHNCHQVTELIRLLIEHDVDHIDLCTERAGSCEIVGIDETDKLSSEQSNRLHDQIEEAIEHYPEKAIFFVDSDADWTQGSDAVRCGSLISVMIVHSNGNVSVCEMIHEDPEVSYGNIHQSSLKEIWAGPAHRKILERTTDRSNVDSRCSDCHRLDYCATGCFNLSKLAEGNYFTKDPRCPGAQAINATMSNIDQPGK